MKNDGGPAFPAEEWIDNGDPFIVNPTRHCGMTLRDWFAGMALQGVMATASGLGNMTEEERGEHLGEVAAILYDMSDAMLAARKENQ